MIGGKRIRTLMELSPNKSGSLCKKARDNCSPKKSAPISCDLDKENYNLFFDDSFTFDDDDTDNLENATKKSSLNLVTWKRCSVENVLRDAHTLDLVLELSDKSSAEDKGDCRLQGPWAHTKVECGDIVFVQAVWNDNLMCFTVNRDDGLLVTNPDQLISGTSVVGSLFCARKGVLQEKFCGIDSDNKIMTIGSIIHELFQIVLSRKLTTSEQIYAASQELLHSKNMMYTLYESRMSLKELERELEQFVINIASFVERYIVGSSKKLTDKDSFAGSIDFIQDIEENLWVPQLGLKGKIDVSVRVSQPRKFFNTKFMPLELKTGKASFSAEHKGQLILYQMMLKEIGKKVDAGLLLYLREGIMKEIKATKNEQRDLIMLRNELSYYLTRDIKSNDLENLEVLVQKFKSLELPEPISHRTACSQCSYNTVCCIYLSNDKTLSNHTFLKSVAEECMSHLKPREIEYFVHWCGLLALEDQDLKKSSHAKSLWTKTPEQRRDNGHAIINLKIIGSITQSEGKFLHTFKSLDANCLSQSGTIHDLTLTGINPGDYVILSTVKRISIASGHVHVVTKNDISVRLERNLLDNYQDESFIIDKHISQSTNVFNYTNLGVLLENREESNQLRKIVVDRIKPTFSKILPKIISKKGADIIVSLNLVQRKAALKALTANEYLLLKGLPGTGKTQTLVAIIRLLDLMGKSVIITSHTNSAVDNVLQRLKSHSIKFLRLGSDSRIDSSLHSYSETNITSACTTPEELARIYSAYNVIGVTCLGSSHSIFLHRKFDVCIVDEATQVLQPTILRPLFYAKKFILVGDPDQLPPIVKSKLGRNVGASESLFQRLDHPDATAVLSIQYRMNKAITKLANELTYKGELTCANEIVKNSCINLPNREKLLIQCSTKKWLLRSLEQHVDQSVILIDTKNCLQRSTDFEKSRSNGLAQLIEKTFTDETVPPRMSHKFTYTNYCDAAIVFSIVKGLLTGGYSASNIGIVAPYRAQVELLRKILQDSREYLNSSNSDIKFGGLEINTVDQYQGRDKDIIIYSCTRTGNLDNVASSVRDIEILEDRRRLTVAITRSKFKLIIIGDEQCLNGYTPFKDLLEKIPSRCKISLEDGKLGFSWNDVFSDLEKVLEM